MRATGIGSMPGTHPEPISRWIADTFANDLIFVPELPARGAPAAMIGRTLGLLDLDVDMLLGRWRMGAARGLDADRARSMYRQDLDAMEEALEGEPRELKQQFAGPFTLAAGTELRSGQSVLSDAGAVNEMAQAVAHAIGEQTVALARRFGAAPVIQIDEPSAPAVLAGQIRTTSGYARYHSFSGDQTRHIWGLVTDVIHAAGAKAVVHSCAPDLDARLVREAGFDGISFDMAHTPANDMWAEALEAGVELGPGALEPRAIESFVQGLGFSLETVHDQLVISPSCGLANLTAAESRATLEHAIATRASLSG